MKSCFFRFILPSFNMCFCATNFLDLNISRSQILSFFTLQYTFTLLHVYVILLSKFSLLKSPAVDRLEIGLRLNEFSEFPSCNVFPSLSSYNDCKTYFPLWYCWKEIIYIFTNILSIVIKYSLVGKNCYTIIFLKLFHILWRLLKKDLKLLLIL